MSQIRVLKPSELAAARALLGKACIFDQASQVAEEMLFGDAARNFAAEPLAAYLGDALVGVACTSGPWLRVLATLPEHREQGIGTALLQRCEAQMRKHASTARVLDQPGNYLSPGVDQKNTETIAWLERRGYSQQGSATNLLLPLEGNERVTQAQFETRVQRCADAGYRIERLADGELDETCEIVATTFSEGWAFELRRAHTASAGVHIAVHVATNAFAGFAAHDGNNAGLGWFGPTGTLEAHRGRGLGAALLLACLRDIHKAGHSHCQVAWIGPRAFYDKIAGIERERHFTTMRKELP